MSVINQKPLTPEKLLEMDGKPAYWAEDESYGIISVDDGGRWGGIPFFRGRKKGANFEYDIQARKMKVYAVKPPRLDREAWRAEWVEKSDDDGCVWFECSACEQALDSLDEQHPFCPSCGRAMTDSAWQILEKRIGVIR